MDNNDQISQLTGQVVNNYVFKALNRYISVKSKGVSFYKKVYEKTKLYEKEQLISFDQLKRDLGEKLFFKLLSEHNKKHQIKDTHRPKTKVNKDFIPKYRSNGYFILNALLKLNLQGNGATKNQIIEQITEDDLSSSFCSNQQLFKDMNSLVNNELVIQSGRPFRYHLSFRGEEIAKKLKIINSEEKKDSTNCQIEDNPIYLIIDNRELKSQKEKEMVHKKMEMEKINLLVKNLSAGDMLWTLKNEYREHVVLDHIVERKTLNDLAQSIKDGRYEEQKSRLKNCGISNVIYVIEGSIDSYGSLVNPPISYKAILTAISTMTTRDHFLVRNTLNTNETFDYIVNLSRFIQKNYREAQYKTIKGNAQTIADVVELVKMNEKLKMDLELFNLINSKTKQLTIKEYFAKMLTCLYGLTTNKASSIVDKYPTPMRLYEEYIKLNISTNEDCSRLNFNNDKTEKNSHISDQLSQLIYNIFGPCVASD